jgi:hypothetical protein
MPGNQVRDWAPYEKLRAEGHSKESAARIANAAAAKRLPKPPKGKRPTKEGHS